MKGRKNSGQKKGVIIGLGVMHEDISSEGVGHFWVLCRIYTNSFGQSISYRSGVSIQDKTTLFHMANSINVHFNSGRPDSRACHCVTWLDVYFLAKLIPNDLTYKWGTEMHINLMEESMKEATLIHYSSRSSKNKFPYSIGQCHIC